MDKFYNLELLKKHLNELLVAVGNGKTNVVSINIEIGDGEPFYRVVINNPPVTRGTLG